MPDSTDQSDGKPTERMVPVRVFLVPLAFLLVAGALVGGFLVGQGTRKSDDTVAREQRAAVSRAVERKGAEDKAMRLRIMERQEERLKARHRVVLRRVVRKLKKSMERRSQQAYASGSQAGFSSGRQEGVEEGIEEGIQEGLERGSDDLVCSDDPDVPLPFC